jgi:hypothetical protein
VGANYDFRSQSRYVHAGEYVHESSGLASSGVQYSAGGAHHDYRSLIRAPQGHAGTASSRVQNSMGVAGSVRHDANHDALVAAVVDSYGMYPDRGVVDLTGVSYSVNAHHYGNNHNMVHDAIPITYAPPGLDVSRGDMHSAIPIGYDPLGLNVSRGSGHSAIPIGYDQHGTDGSPIHEVWSETSAEWCLAQRAHDLIHNT